MIDREAESQSERDYKMIESLRAELAAAVDQSDTWMKDATIRREVLTATAQKLDKMQARAEKAERENEGLKNGSRDLMLINSKMSAALDASDRLADYIDGCRSLNDGVLSDFCDVYQAARAAVGKAGGDWKARAEKAERERDKLRVKIAELEWALSDAIMSGEACGDDG